MWLIASLSSWPPWCLSQQVTLYHPWPSMPLTVIPTPQKQLALKLCLSWGMNLAPIAASTTFSGSSYILMWMSSMTLILRPTKKLRQEVQEGHTDTNVSNCASSGKRHFLIHIQIQPKRKDHRVSKYKKRMTLRRVLKASLQKERLESWNRLDQKKTFWCQFTLWNL